MCGRYVAATPPDQLADYFAVQEIKSHDVPPSWNVAPTREVYAVAERTVRNDDGEPATTTPEHVRQLGTFRWGLVPSWAKDPGIGSTLINARVESVADKPAFRKALTKRRCIIPADAFYEWQLVTGKKTKQPWLVRRADGEPMAFAGLWEVWRDAGAEREGAEWLRSCAIVTTNATGRLGDIHERCPVILERGEWDAWLDRGLTDPGEVLSLLHPAPVDLLELHPVRKLVNDVRNDDPSLVEPAPPEEAAEADPPTLFDDAP